MLSLESQTLNNIIATKLETARATSLALGDISNPSPLPVRQWKIQEQRIKLIALAVLHQDQRQRIVE